MAYDPENHVVDPKTGFLVHKETGHRIGLEQAPAAAPGAGGEYPKWIVPHDSHVVRQKLPAGEHISTPLFECHVHHVTKVVTVLVEDSEEEAVALGPMTLGEDNVTKLQPKKK